MTADCLSAVGIVGMLPVEKEDDSLSFGKVVDLTFCREDGWLAFEIFRGELFEEAVEFLQLDLFCLTLFEQVRKRRAL